MKLFKNQLITLFVFLFLALALPLSLSLVSQRQEIRKKAAGTGKVKLTLEPTGNVQKGETITINIKIEATEAVEIGVGGVELGFDPTFFSVSESSLRCGDLLPNLDVASVTGNKISLTCHHTPPFPSLSAGQKVTLGTFQARVLDTASDQTEIRFLRTEVVDVSLEDISDQGTTGIYRKQAGEAAIFIVCPSAGTGCDYVGGDGIQQAVDAIPDGGSVIIKPGYYENVEIQIGIGQHPTPKHNITIKGETGGDLPILDDGQKGVAIKIGGDSRVTIENLIIKNSKFEGIGLVNSSQATIQNNQISGNQGSGIFLVNSSQATIQNNQISGNQGDGISLGHSSQAKIINNTLYKNKETGINIYQCGDSNPSVEARNNIITHTEKNTDGTFGFGIGGRCLHDPGKLDNDTFAYNLIWGNERDNTECGGMELCENFPGRINADPKFVNPEGGDFHLQPDSPAIDSGDPDIKDPDGSRSDMGVYGGPGACGSDPNLPGCISAPTSTPTPTPPTATATPTSTPTPTLTPTPTPNPPGQVKAKFKVKFSGVDNKKPDQIVKVKIGRGETVIQELEQVSLTANNQGIYESQMITLSSAITPGTNYYLLIKGPKHLQVKFCQNTGQTRPCTTGKITLNSGENTLDFTGYPLPGGDLPPQDGVVNSLDAVALTNCLFQTSSTCLQKADLNFDEIVNTMDINIMNNTIYTRWEDE